MARLLRPWRARAHWAGRRKVQLAGGAAGASHFDPAPRPKGWPGSLFGLVKVPLDRQVQGMVDAKNFLGR